MTSSCISIKCCDRKGEMGRWGKPVTPTLIPMSVTIGGIVMSFHEVMLRRTLGLDLSPMGIFYDYMWR